MEQNEELKNELQQDLQALQQHVEHHSSFQNYVWHRAVKRHSRQLYRKNLFSAIFLIIIIAASNIVLFLDAWPWWLLAPIDLFLAVIVVDSIIAHNDFRKVDVKSHGTSALTNPQDNNSPQNTDIQSRERLLTLRECMKKNTIYSKRKRIIIQIVAAILLVALYIYLFLYQRELFVPTLIGGLVAALGGRRTSKRIKKQYDELGEEIDELLKE